MSFAFDLSRYEDVKDNAAAIAERLSDGSMPCDGPWPEERVALFRQWMSSVANPSAAQSPKGAACNSKSGQNP